MRYRNLCIGLLLIATGCVFSDKKTVEKPQAVIAPETSIAEIKNPIPPLVIVGEGGTSGFLFQYAADTYVEENGGEKYTVHDGDEFIAVMKDFQDKHGVITSFVYFGHGNEVGLYVNQSPTVNGGLYANDPGINKKFRAASIYDLPRTVFASGSTALFYGCNVAQEKAGLDSFAEQFANHFRTTVIASTGPTEFSFNKNTKTQGALPAKVITESLYMIPSAAKKGFVTITPSPAAIAQYDDVHQSTQSADAIAALTELGLTLDAESSFSPYQFITAADAQAFCKLIDAACIADEIGDPETGLVRNTAALKLLLDAAGYNLKRTSVPYEAQIRFATLNNLLTHDFIHKRWYTRGEMALLTWNVLQMKNVQ